MKLQVHLCPDIVQPRLARYDTPGDDIRPFQS